MRKFIWSILVFLRIFKKEEWLFRDAKLEHRGFIKLNSGDKIENEIILFNGHKYYRFSAFYIDEYAQDITITNCIIEYQLEKCFLHLGFRYAFIFWWELVVKKNDYVRFRSDGTVEIQ